ncbi:MAG: ATP-binding protein, partial [Alphaproteobacteria bacterium]|nr:ATP-binding protein [Alphaproteobacteria bacterium]
MDIEFHYYMTYLIAAKAGLGAAEAGLLAHASQYIDDNDLRFEIDKGQGSAYRNYISQTMNILKPKASLLRIYPIFHFIPGDPQSQSAWRKDGKMHWLNTTPNSDNANRVMDAAVRQAKFPAVKSLDSFDFKAIPSLNKMLVLELARGEYTDRHENVIALG